ncbi:lipopolysaccharide biosynthesis protein [Rhodococcus pyridinivorans]|uniref:lipopolysaccharide biosynthesis protein n=1 Tax=Rhodococcus pyridinivorans TaxID=103816 RepID=UPI0009E82856|nr:lipopolysaccharide biosynthesis protein [Rhodococcus pyridinivorans]MCD2141541.1 lipopolysaccharide biosynthesis protein [Rhodococcus pyridinivorans]
MTSTISKIGRQASWIVLGRLGGALIQAGSMALLARWIGPSEFGLFASAYGIALVLQTVIDLGLTTYIVRLRALEPTSEYLKEALRIVSRISILTGILGVAGMSIMTWHDPRYLPFIPFAVWIAVDRQVETWLAIPLADGDTIQNATSLVTRRSISFMVLIVAAATGFDPLLGYTFGLALGSTISCFVVMEKNRVPFRRFKVPARKVIETARPYWANSVATQLRNFDTLIVTAIAGTTQGGYYGAASRLTTPLRIIPTSFAQVLMPAAARSGKPGRKALLRSVIILMAATALLYAVVAVIMPLVVPLVLGEDFDDSILIIQIVCGGLAFAAISSQMNSLLQGWGQLRQVAVISAITSISCLLGVAVAAIWWGGVGAAIALTASYILQVVLLAGIVVLQGRG